MTATIYSLDDVAELLATADDQAWYALGRDEQDRYRRMAREIEHRIRDDEDVVVDADELDDLRTRAAAAETALERAEKALGLEEDALTGEGIDVVVKAALDRAREQGTKDALVPSRENAATKGRRLLIEGRLAIARVVTEGDLAGLIVAKCRGDSAEIYTLGYDPRQRQWRCTCPEMRGNCSHLHALKLVTTIVTPT